MKRRLIRIKSVIYLILLPILLTVCFESCSPASSSINSTNYMYSLTPADCEQIFGVLPQQFKSTYFPFYNQYGDLRLKSSVDENGNLIIALDSNQYFDIHKHYMDLIERSTSAGIGISDDYTIMTIKGYQEDVWDVLRSYGLGASTGMIGIQNLNNGYGNWVITLRLVDEVSGEVVFEETFRDVFNISNETVSNLTPRPQESTSDSTEITETTTQNP